MNKVLEVENLQKWFPLYRGFVASLFHGEQKKFIRAVDGISFYVNEAEIFGLAGESGCGKTTTGELIAKLLDPTGGKIKFKGADIDSIETDKFRKNLQMIFQDPYQSINPRFKIKDWVMEPLKIHHMGNEQEQKEMVESASELSDLTPPQNFMERYPHELSGGQRQRVAIARAIVTQPSFIVADEPTSMLDVSTRANILQLLELLRSRFKISMILISHDLGIIRYVCDRIAIMYLGKIMEMGLTEQVLTRPAHPYTKALKAAVPDPDPDVKRKRVSLRGEIPDSLNIPSGCRFFSRCNNFKEICRETNPELIEIEKNHFVACLNLENEVKL